MGEREPGGGIKILPGQKRQKILRNLADGLEDDNVYNIPDVDLVIDALHGAVGQVALIRLTRDGTFDADEVADQLNPLIATGLEAQ